MNPHLLPAALRGDDAARARLAEHRDTPPEMLFFLASDPAIAVRAAIAANAATPPLADRVLAADPETGVRRVLARKLAALAPMLAPDAADRLRRTAWDTLFRLTDDTAVAVRAAVTEVLAELPDAPRAVILRLARDAAMAVAEPVLRFSPVLTEGDLLLLIAEPPAAETRAAIARRPGLGALACDALAFGKDPATVAVLLANREADIRTETLDTLAARAGAEPAWQEPLVHRPRLGHAAARALAGIVADGLLRTLAARGDLEPGLAHDLHRRLAERRTGSAPSWDMDESGFLRAATGARLEECGRILAGLSGLPAGPVTRAVSARSARTIVALCWKAGLSVRAARMAQTILAGVPAAGAMTATGGWPLTPDAMRREIEALLAPSPAPSLN